MARKDLEGRLPIVYMGKSVEEWYQLYTQQALKIQVLEEELDKLRAAVDDLIALAPETNPATYMRVTYEIPPTRALHTAEFGDTTATDAQIIAMLRESEPTWHVKKIERNLTEE